MKNISEIKIGICIPTIREDCLVKFLKEWQPQFDLENINFYITEDNETLKIDYIKAFKEYKNKNVKIYSHKEIKEDLKNNSWIICKKNSSHRSYGYLQAYKDNCDMIVTLDDDCYPLEDVRYLEAHWNKLNAQVDMWGSSAFDKNSDRIPVRGIPYKNRTVKDKVIINHGLWKNNLDLDAVHQLLGDLNNKEIDIFRTPTVFSKYRSLCGMSLAFKKEATPLMYFGLQGEDWMFDRFDDIWCGIIAQKIVSHLGKYITNGTPMIWHDRASDPFKNLIKEAQGVQINETFWQFIEEIQLVGKTYRECFRQIAKELKKFPEEKKYFNKLSEAMIIWLSLFK